MSDLPESYAEQLDRKRFDRLEKQALEAADKSKPLRVIAVALFVVLLLDGIFFFMVFGAILFGGAGWGLILWPIGIASGSAILAFLGATILGACSGWTAGKRNDSNGFLN